MAAGASILGCTLANLLAAATFVLVPRFFDSALTGTTPLSRSVQLMPEWAVSLLAHLVYGTVLGWLYDLRELA